MNMTKRKWILTSVYTLFSFLIMFAGAWMSPWKHLLFGLILVLSAVGLYFFIVFAVADRNWLDIRAMFTGIWFGTVGLAAFRLTGYQEEWQSKTWIILAFAVAAFQIGATLGIDRGRAWYPALKRKASGLKIGRIRFSLKKERLFWVCVVTTLIGLLCFSINVAIKGFIPCFSDSLSAYVDFYTKFHVFAVAATGISGLCYYCIRTQNLKLWKKIILYLCILYSTFLFPIMVVSRGVFVVSALSLTVVVFYLDKKRFLALVLCLAVILGVYWGCSQLRNYSDEYLSAVFDPIEVDVDKDSTDENDGSAGGFMLSPKMAFLYGYLTVSHDNFNESVQNVEEYTYGVRQLAPFNVILRSQWIKNRIADTDVYIVTPNLKTTNLIGDFYYDFGGIGVVVLLLIWAFVFGLNQGMYESGNGIFSLLLLGNTMVPVVLSFFSPWLSVFNHWMLWGVVLLYAIASCIRVDPKSKKNQ